MQVHSMHCIHSMQCLAFRCVPVPTFSFLAIYVLLSQYDVLCDHQVVQSLLRYARQLHPSKDNLGTAWTTFIALDSQCNTPKDKENSQISMPYILPQKQKTVWYIRIGLEPIVDARCRKEETI